MFLRNNVAPCVIGIVCCEIFCMSDIISPLSKSDSCKLIATNAVMSRNPTTHFPYFLWTFHFTMLACEVINNHQVSYNNYQKLQSSTKPQKLSIELHIHHILWIQNLFAFDIQIILLFLIRDFLYLDTSRSNICITSWYNPVYYFPYSQR